MNENVVASTDGSTSIPVITSGMTDWEIIFATLGAVASVTAIILAIVGLVKFINNTRTPRVNTYSVPKAKGIQDNLPSIGLVVGRKDKVKELLRKVKRYHMIFLQGVGGIGKSTLAVCAARKYRRIKRVHVIWVTSKNKVLSLENILNSIAHFFGFIGLDSLMLDDKKVKVLQILKRNNSLIILDNYETIEDDIEIKAFLNAIGKNCKIIITSRNNTIVSQDQVTIHVGDLNNKNAILLMRKELKKNGRHEVRVDDCKKLLEIVGGSPLAIKWSIGQIATNGHTVETICTQLREGVEAGSPELFEDIFAIAWQELNDAQKDILYLLQFFVTPVSAKALWKLSGISDETKFMCEFSKLLKLSLIDSNTKNAITCKYFSMHSLTGYFVYTELKKVPNGVCRIARRILTNYKEFCLDRCQLPNGSTTDYDAVEREWQNIDKTLRFSVENINSMENPNDVKNDILEISKSINVFLWSRGYWQERIDVCKLSVDIAESLNRNEEAGYFACFIGIVLFWQSKNHEAEKWADKAETFLTNSIAEKKVLAERLRGLTLLGNNQYDSAIEKLKNVYTIVSPKNGTDVAHADVAIIADWVAPSAEGYKAGRVSLLQEIGICYNRKGDYDSALKFLRNSESLARSISDDEGLSISLSHIGHSLVGLGMYRAARAAYNEGLSIALSIGRKSTTARCYEGLTRVSKKQRNIISMYINGRKALVLYERLNMKKELKDVENILAINFFKRSV